MKKRRGGRLKFIILAVAAAVVILGFGSQTLAWLTDSASAANTFIKGSVPPEVEESFNGTVKRDVKIRNTGTAPAYIRVSLIPIWRGADGSNSGLAAEGTYSITLRLGERADEWTADGGYYYYNSPVPAEEATGVLVTECTVKSQLGAAYDGKTFELGVIASSLQSEGWDGTVTNARQAFAAAKTE